MGRGLGGGSPGVPANPAMLGFCESGMGAAKGLVERGRLVRGPERATLANLHPCTYLLY